MAPKILMMSDFPELATGQAVVIREISKGLFNTKKYDINVAGWGYNGMPHNLPYQVYPCSAKGFGKDGIPEANIPGLEQLIDLVKPDILWTVGDIWDFSREYNVIQCLLYAEGFDRLGCIGCPQGQEYGRKRDFARWPGFQRTWIYWFGRVMEIRKEKGLKCTFKSAEDWFEWWLSDKAQEMPIARGSLKCSGMIRNVRGLSRLCAAAARLRQAHGGLHQGAGGCGV